MAKRKFQVLDCTFVLTHVRPHHAEEGIDGDRVRTSGQCPLGYRAGLFEPAHPCSS
jgi:hypothetical protein